MIVVAVALAAATSSTAAAEPAFTYQGQLKQNGVPVTGEADFDFYLWDAETGGTELANNYIGAVSLDNGLFTVQLAFDAALFDGSPRFLEVHVAVPSGGAFTPLAARQPITPAPYALALPALRTEQDAISPNILAGHGDNIITEGAHGVTLSGGGSAAMDSNAVTDDFGTIGGGARNRAGNNVGTTADATAATVGGGSYNQASAQYATIAGGHSNYATGVGSAIGGGSDNSASADRAAVGGGEENNATGAHAAIAGGSANNADGRYAAVGGGVDNIAGGQAGAVPGGRGNRANGENSFAAGYRAQADHEATFVWSDATDTAFFTSTGPNQFLIKAAGGMGINTNAPGAALHIGGTPAVDGLMFPDGTLQTTAAGGGGDSWGLAGNVGTTPGANFVGTTDDQPLELHVDGDRALRIEPTYLSPNLIGGYRENMVSLDVVEATISGGGQGGAINRVTDTGGTIGGGTNNQAGDDAGTAMDAAFATVAGGSGNTASGLWGTVSGGHNNTASGTSSAVGGGENNNASDINSVVSGGTYNNASGNHGVVAGGYFNTASGGMSAVGGGQNNRGRAPGSGL
jgi:hypothetical protein